jgi:Bacteriodetes cell division protein (FtsL-like)
MESTIAAQMEAKNIFPSSVPPKKIKVAVEKTRWEKLWQ